jgi:hypothetical protein
MPSARSHSRSRVGRCCSPPGKRHADRSRHRSRRAPGKLFSFWEDAMCLDGSPTFSNPGDTGAKKVKFPNEANNPHWRLRKRTFAAKPEGKRTHLSGISVKSSVSHPPRSDAAQGGIATLAWPCVWRTRKPCSRKPEHVTRSARGAGGAPRADQPSRGQSGARAEDWRRSSYGMPPVGERDGPVWLDPQWGPVTSLSISVQCLDNQRQQLYRNRS